MSVTTSDVLGSASWDDEADIEWLHLLVGDWQLLADLAFSDLTLWVPGRSGWAVAAHVRPTTGVSLFTDDPVGDSPSDDVLVHLRTTLASGEAQRLTQEWDDEPVQLDVVPVRHGGRCIAVLSRTMRLGSIRRRGRLESTYLGLADALFSMIAAGAFPDADGAVSSLGGAPRVGDGVIALDEGACVTYASPNAVSALRRLGVESNVAGARLRALLDDRGVTAVGGPEEASVVLAGRAPWYAEFRGGSAVVMARAVPLVRQGHRFGAALLLRDITELRRRDRELMTKDATIREIHHRVKNNLQTVAALLRLQGRRLTDEEAQRALADAGRRVAVIAAVHDALSTGFAGAVDFDEVAERGLVSGVDVARRSEAPVVTRLEGSFGVLASEDATTLAMVLGELVQNAVEHGLAGEPGTVVVRATREADTLTVRVSDDGVGYEREPSASGGGGLGTQIVTTFVRDMRGEIEWTQNPLGGTDATFTARLRPLEQGSACRTAP